MAEAVEPAFFVRRADPDDVDTIGALFDRSFSEDVLVDIFAGFHGLDPSILRTAAKRQKFWVSLIETCFMSVTVEDEEGNVAAFAALDDVPVQMMNAHGAGTLWEDWFQHVYEDPEVDSTNSLWLSCLLSDPDPGVMSELLQTTFSTMNDIQHLMVFVPASVVEEEAAPLLAPFELNFQQLQPAGNDWTPPQGHWAPLGQDGQRPTVLICSRPSVITPLCIRMARVEDHDNLAAVFDAQSEVVKEVYGEYFIAELIEAQNEENKALVAEVDSRAVGLLCLTSDVDINVLAQCFQLDPYDNLLKPNYMRRVREHAAAVFSGDAHASLCSTGDYMQVALASIDIDGLLESLPGAEDGRVSAVHLHDGLQQQEFSDELGEAVPVQDFEKGVMTLLWQANFTEPMLEMTSLVESRRVRECVQVYMSLHINARKELAQMALDKWQEVESVLTATREQLAAQEEQAEAAQAGEGGEPAEEAGQAEEAADEAPPPVELAIFLRALTEEQEGPFPQGFVARLVMTLHWWTDEDLGNPLQAVPADGFKASLEKVMDSEEGLFVGHPNSPAWLTNMPQHAKDVFCVNMCCLDQTYQTQALDFLLPAFSLYPNKDYCIVTQPHTAPNTPLLNAFTIVPPQPQNTFGHVLYLIHRAALLGPPRVRYLKQEDLPSVPGLIENFDAGTQEDITSGLAAVMEHDDSAMSKHAFVAEFDDQVVGLILLEVPAPDAVDTLCCCYHLDDYLLVEHHEGQENKGHARLAHWALNPLFQKFTRRMLQGSLRLCGRTVFFVEMDLKNTVSPIFRELLQVAPRRPPQLKKAIRKPPKVASFANVEKEVPDEEDLREKERQRLLRDAGQTRALSVVAKKLLSETKIPVNARIVVVGASDCGLSFLESLLSIPHLLFNSLTLLAPGGLEYHHSHHLPLVAGTAAYSHQELRRIMLELRVRVLDSRMVQVDRRQRCCVLQDGSLLPYDCLVVAAGLQDDALHCLRIRSWGVEHVTDGYRRVNGAMSAADPSIRDLLVEGGTLVKSLIWNPLSYAVVYGRSLNAYCVVQGLLLRRVPPSKIILVLPPRLQDASQQLPVDAFYDGDEVERKIHDILQSMDVKVYEGYRLLGIQQDNRERLKALVLEEHPGASRGGQQGQGVAASEAGSQSARSYGEVSHRATAAKTHCGTLEDHGITPKGLPQKLLACRIIITADSVNVDPDIFNSVHGNGLVYDGRLIVDHNFMTTDDAIFGAGALCEFSRRFQRKNAERYLRHDGFNGREVGAKLAQALLRSLDPVNGDLAAAGAVPRPLRGMANGQEAGPPSVGMGKPESGMEGPDGEESSPELLPEFYMPIARGGLLPGNLHYYRIHACRRGELQSEQVEARADRTIVTDTLDTANGCGHFCRLTVDGFGRVDSITYLGGEELQVESLWSLVGLSETFLNHLFVRWRDGDIPDIVEFLTDEWATALFHDRFMDFCHQIRLEMLSQDEVKAIISNALETVNPKEGLSRKLLAQIRQQLPKESVRAIQDRLLNYLHKNMNHLKSYYLPEG